MDNTDIMIKPCDRDKSHQVMLDNGFSWLNGDKDGIRCKRKIASTFSKSSDVR